ncbi:MAG: ribosomal-protein-alanine N-acetyltransferase [Cyanobacteria bacterium SIG30]|nr:ribosomal-protein-alanine N-acetyltransferase [Cyanobacteria bacterium SIG30]
MLDFKIETLKDKHLDDVMEIEALSYGKHHWSRESFESEILNSASSYLSAVNKNGKCIGYMGIWKIIDEAHITTLAVHPDYRKNNVAKALLLAQIDECTKYEIKYLTLEVRPSNKSAISLYEKFGFNSLGVRKNYYQDNNEDALIMWTKDILSDEYKNLYNKIKEEIK